MKNLGEQQNIPEILGLSGYFRIHRKRGNLLSV